MKSNMQRRYKTGSGKINEDEGKIELVSCPNNESFCKDHISVINMCYVESEQYRQDKNYQLTIENLRKAFDKTTELTHEKCIRCADLFRSTIADSLDDLRGDLKKMSSGFFGNKSYLFSLQIAEKTLIEFKNAKPLNNIQIDSTNDLQSNN